MFVVDFDIPDANVEVCLEIRGIVLVYKCHSCYVLLNTDCLLRK